MFSDDRVLVIRFVLLMGAVSLFADMVYESCRGVMGPYLGHLGANAFAIGVVFGLGEFFGYFLRIFAGFLLDRTKKYWSFMFIGYGLIVSVPLLALADYWLLAGTLIIMERVGKALRAPAKDTLLSIYSKGIGKGLTFGIHETADQVGAVIGPALFYLLLTIGLGYKNSFLILFIPFFVMVATLLFSRSYASKIHIDLKEDKDEKREGNRKVLVYLYLLFIFITSLGFIGFPVISFHSVKAKLLSETMVPLAYSLVMVLDALVAVPIGLLYDRFGIKVMLAIPVLIATLVIFTLSNSLFLLILGLALWGVVMSAYETVIRAYIGDNVSLAERGRFYGIFNTVLGVSLALSNSVAGYLYEINKNLIIYLVVLVELLSLSIILITAFISRRIKPS